MQRVLSISVLALTFALHQSVSPAFAGFNLVQQTGDFPLSEEPPDHSWTVYINSGDVAYLSEASAAMR
ncbi:MAG: hypothetical protein IRY99_19160 [Isosphaeraceae bacterium]|nr:hypothetical protein [Isosphaeraceae bacterium]